ncbi:malonyl-CoA decarboxylase [Salvia divinorum]|uniref:Malonyl-CoA decarboxylase n=1 Tax=Salvia divinorum TaxID=28513 RepID=A0ABD1I2I2_SALDI
MNNNRKALSILLRARMRPLSPTTNRINQMQFPPIDGVRNGKVSTSQDASATLHTDFVRVQQSMHSAISMNKTEILDVALDDFSEGYYGLPNENRRALLLTLAREYDLNRKQVRDLMKQYLGLELPSSEKPLENAHEGEGSFSAFYRIERTLRESLKPMYEVLFERLNTHPGGLRFLSIMRADILSFLAEENTAVLRALDSYLKEKLITWLSPANLQLHHITWDDSASLLEKIVAHEAVHPISNLLDLKRRLGMGRRCFGYLHPAIPGEPLIFIEVALMKHVAQTIQEVLWDDPPIPECEATCALFYSISSTQPGLSGINLGKFLIKRVIDVVRRDMTTISTFATLSPIPGYMQWLLSKLAPTEISDSTFSENLLTPVEESALLEATEELTMGKNGMEVLRNLLSSSDKWINSENLASVLRIPLMRLCARYLLQEKKRGKALDSVGNFHLQNGAMVGRINWMADLSEKGLKQSAGIMVNYIYEVEHIEENAQSYFGDGDIGSSDEVRSYLEPRQEDHQEEIKD